MINTVFDKFEALVKYTQIRTWYLKLKTQLTIQVRYVEKQTKLSHR